MNVSRRLAGVAAVLLPLATASCASLQNIDVAELRQDRHLYKTVEVDKSLQEIRGSLYTHRNECRPLPEVSVNPDDPSKGVLVMTGAGFTKPSALLVMDFNEAPDHQTTRINAYTYYVTWNHNVDRVLEVIDNPGKC